jgi:hypothetical protein
MEGRALAIPSSRHMPVIKPTCLRDLKLRVNLADVVTRMVTLRKAGGSRLKGLCPFHNEKSPSFHVDADKGFYKCFGCGKAGDVITFVRETEQLNFSEAVEALGKRFGVPIEYEEGSGGPSTAGSESRTAKSEDSKGRVLVSYPRTICRACRLTSLLAPVIQLTNSGPSVRRQEKSAISRTMGWFLGSTAWLTSIASVAPML